MKTIINFSKAETLPALMEAIKKEFKDADVISIPYLGSRAGFSNSIRVYFVHVSSAVVYVSPLVEYLLEDVMNALKSSWKTGKIVNLEEQ